MRIRFLAPLAAAAVLVLPACSKPAATPATGTAADEQAVRAISTKYADAFTKHDAQAMGAIMTEDYEDVDAMGMHTQGRAAAEKMMTSQFAMMPPGVAMTATTTYVKWLNANNAVAGGTWEMTGTPPGMPNKGAWMGVAVKKDSTWQMVSSLGADAPPAMPMPMPDMTKKAKSK